MRSGRPSLLFRYRRPLLFWQSRGSSGAFQHAAIGLTPGRKMVARSYRLRLGRATASIRLAEQTRLCLTGTGRSQPSVCTRRYKCEREIHQVTAVSRAPRNPCPPCPLADTYDGDIPSHKVRMQGKAGKLPRGARDRRSCSNSRNRQLFGSPLGCPRQSSVRVRRCRLACRA